MAAGELDREAAKRWLLPPGVPVTVGCSDVAATLLGIDARPAELALVVGTGAQAIRPVAQVASDAAPRRHAYRAVDGSRWRTPTLCLPVSPRPRRARWS